MYRIEKYIEDPENIVKELRREPRHIWWKLLLVTVFGLALFLFYLWFYVTVLGFDLPKTALLRRQNAAWHTRIDRMSQQLDRYDELLTLLEVRDDRIYRSVYGLDEVPQALRFSGLGGDSRYTSLEGTSLYDVIRRLDVLEKRTFIQSKSFDDIATLQQSAGDRRDHVPAIPPMSTDRNTYRLSSPFGYRSDPILGFGKRHTGMDFACPPGNPIYATGDGVVVKAADERKGYGRHVEIDHGFGYKTRYAHLSRIDVAEGQTVRRGDCLGLSGRSGRVTGPHLHYEVLYRKDYVNPSLYMDLDIAPEDYYRMVRRPAR